VIVARPRVAPPDDHPARRRNHRLSSTAQRPDSTVHHTPTQETPLLSATLIFFIVAILAGALGFGALSGLAATIAKICFVLFLIVFLVSLLRGRAPAV